MSFQNLRSSSNLNPDPNLNYRSFNNYIIEKKMMIEND